MTILPTKRAVSNNSNDESNDNGNSSNSKERSSRHRDEHSGTSEQSTSSRRQFTYSNGSERKDLQKLYKESSLSNVREQRERERQKQRELRRERKRDRQNKRTNKNEGNETSDSTASNDNAVAEPSNPIVEKKDKMMYVDEDGSGCNSEDEYDSRRPMTIASPTAEEWARRDAYFSRCLLKLGYEIKKMHEDGACLFRAIADQVYGDQELHSTVRSQCMDYIVKNQDFFAPYVTEDFHKYVERKRRWHVHGNHLEIQALSEMYNRTIEVYCYHTEPINIFNASSMNAYEPIRVSYHRMCHYNSITNPKKPSVLVGLGLPNYCTRCDLDRRDIHDAVRQSEDMLIEQTMLEDKIKATDWEATNEAIEEQVARESYIQFYRDVERRLKADCHSAPSAAAGSSSTVTSAVCSSPRTSRRGSVSPKGSMSPKGNLSPRNFSGSPRISATALETTSTLTAFENTDYNKIMLTDTAQTATYQSYGIEPKNHSETTDGSVPINTQVSGTSSAENNYQREEYQDWDETVMAQVLAESQLTYFEDLKRLVKKRNGSPGPSTSH
ncbi:hypothetical protein RN001_016248 [Aquatica leii]|uniref:ubiquitinyl hydrolase 1 n=1 Tax=Aquatica leii TaxID=1421715 RepID=A0AAN7NXP4_9COLE|nr:hypothetical protein RN001_016248 [Aquatica leii]